MALEYYKYVHALQEIRQPTVITPPEDLFQPHPLVPDAKNITLAQYDPDTAEHITAHRLSDYRKQGFSIMLLPEVSTLFDVVLEGSGYWYEKLHSSSFNINK